MVIPDPAIHRDPRTIVLLEVVHEVLRPGEHVDGQSSHHGGQFADPISEQTADVRLLAPQRWRLCTGRLGAYGFIAENIFSTNSSGAQLMSPIVPPSRQTRTVSSADRFGVIRVCLQRVRSSGFDNRASAGAIE